MLISSGQIGHLDRKQTLPYVKCSQGFCTHPYLDVPRVCIFMVTGGNTEIIAQTEIVR